MQVHVRAHLSETTALATGAVGLAAEPAAVDDGLVLILVPAPRTQSSPESGDPVEIDRLSYPSLSSARGAVLEASGATKLRIAPAVPAADLYGGLLLDAALEGLDAAGLQRARDWIVLVSAAWGALRLQDRVPADRIDMCDRPPGLGHLVQYWQEPFAGVMPQTMGDGLMVDCRSDEYVLTWRPTGKQSERWVYLKPVRDATFERGSQGSMARRMRGVVLHRILEDGLDPRQPEDLAAALAEHFTLRLSEPEREGKPWMLRVVETA